MWIPILVSVLVFGQCPAFATSGGKGGELRKTLEDLIAASGGNRSPGSPGDAAALKWLSKKARTLGGWKVEEQRFSPDVDFAIKGYRTDLYNKLGPERKGDSEYDHWKKITEGLVAWQETLRKKTGANLILSKAGSDSKQAKNPLIVSAHFDTIIHDHATLEIRPNEKAPGADDNGAAVAVLLSLAQRLNGLKPKRPLELVFFDFEEAFFLGSKYYADLLAKNQVQAELVNLEMIGWFSAMKKGEKKPIVKLYIRTAGHPGSARDQALGDQISAALDRHAIDSYVFPNNFDRSDNWSFWNALHFGLTISQDWEQHFDGDHYHTLSDTPDQQDWKTVARIRDALAEVIPRLADK